MTVREQYMREIERHIDGVKEGTLFIARDFTDIAPDDAVRKVLSRLVETGQLERPVRGIYLKPKYSKFLGENAVASPDDIARTIARKFNWSIAPYGDTALNMLGLDTQVPNVYHYVSDGPYRSYKYGPFTLIFSHTANKEVSSLSYSTVLVIQAFKAKGNGNVTDADLKTIASRLSFEDLITMLDETKKTTVWIREICKRIPTVKEKQLA
ncbi:MAG: hypothetical protein HGA54_06785 [Actinobacteria bacterium]|nr:hypothetical protein [Actinomycetota bacterium]